MALLTTPAVPVPKLCRPQSATVMLATAGHIQERRDPGTCSRSYSGSVLTAGCSGDDSVSHSVDEESEGQKPEVICPQSHGAQA